MSYADREFEGISHDQMQKTGGSMAFLVFMSCCFEVRGILSRFRGGVSCGAKAEILPAFRSCGFDLWPDLDISPRALLPDSRLD